MVITIRPYRPEDRDACVAVWLAASRRGHPFLDEADLERQRRLVAEVYLPKAETWVAERDDRLAGFIGLLDDLVGGLFVAPEVAGTGVGRALIEHAFARRGHLVVEVYARNDAARAFYARVGFTETGRKPQDDEGRPLELVIMAR